MSSIKLRAKAPKRVNVQYDAMEHDLVDGLQLSRMGSSAWRCGKCDCMQKGTSEGVSVPDQISYHWSRRRFTSEQITEMCRQSQWMGHFTYWCIHCAKELGRSETRRARLTLLNAVYYLHRPPPLQRGSQWIKRLVDRIREIRRG